MTNKGLERLESMHENHSVALIEEVLRRSGSSSTGTEVVHKSDGVVLQRDRGATRLKEGR